MATVEYVVAVCVSIGFVYGTLRLLWDDEMPNVIG